MKKDIEPSKQDVITLYAYLDKGNAVFKKKSSIENFSTGMNYYDSANRIAEKYDNDSIKFDTYISIARAYDAWNKKPQATVDYYKRASEYAHKMFNKDQAVFCSILVAHALMKSIDFAKAVSACKKIDENEMQNANLSEVDNYYTELAYICVSSKDYPTAYMFSHKVKHPENIQNGSLTYKTYQTITQTSLHLYYLHEDITVWIDSIKQTIARTKNLSDSLSNLSYLIQSYKNIHQDDSAAKYDKIIDTLNDRFGNNFDQSIAKNTFLEYEAQKSEREKRIAALEKQSILNTTIAIAIIAFLSILITFLVLLNRRKVAAKNLVLAQLNKQLEEKADENEMLLKEMHHRVKNNLSLIYSLLEMQGRKTTNNETREQLMMARNRIENIALTHEQLYRNHNSSINMNDYLSKIIISSLKAVLSEKTIIPTIEIAKEINLTADKCLPVAMIINELITNSAKYAQTNEGEIAIAIIAKCINNTISITYSDSGTNNLAEERKEGLGSNIMRILCKQIQATLDTKLNGLPFNYKITFTI